MLFAKDDGHEGGVAHVIDLVPVERAYGDVLLLKDRSYRMLLRVGAINMDLLSPNDQLAALRAWGEMLNALGVTFPLQVVLHSTPMDTTRYRTRMLRRMDEQPLPQMRNLIAQHLDHFHRQARQNFLLDRSRFIAVPYHPRRSADASSSMTGGAASAAVPGGGLLRSVLDRSDPKPAGGLPSSREVEDARSKLLTRAGLILSTCKRLGVSCELLDEGQVARVLSEFLNPGSAAADATEHRPITVRQPDRTRRALGRGAV